MRKKCKESVTDNFESDLGIERLVYLGKKINDKHHPRSYEGKIIVLKPKSNYL